MISVINGIMGEARELLYLNLIYGHAATHAKKYRISTINAKINLKNL
jgi:hypothetical protein